MVLCLPAFGGEGLVLGFRGIGLLLPPRIFDVGDAEVLLEHRRTGHIAQRQEKEVEVSQRLYINGAIVGDLLNVQACLDREVFGI